MYIDEEIKKETDKMHFQYPLKGIYDDLMDSYEKGDDDKFCVLMDDLETSAKQAQISGQIDVATLHKLFHLVGIY